MHSSRRERSSSEPPKFYDTRRFYADARYEGTKAAAVSKRPQRPTTAAISSKWKSVEHVNLGCSGRSAQRMF